MRITCDSSCNMGYIYLMPPKRIFPEEEEGNKIDLYVAPSKLTIPVSDGTPLIPLLNQLPMAFRTYNRALKLLEIDEEYLNDKDKNRYILGIELNLTKQEFLRRISENGFQIFKINWDNKRYSFVTLDTVENVFNPKNTIYAMNSNRDVYLIIQIKEPYRVALIKALISSREDLYPLDYLQIPKYILWEKLK